jgi:hypothetical protein
MMIMKYVGHVTPMGKMRNNSFRNLVRRNLEVRDNLRDLSVNESMILKWSMKNYCFRMWTGSNWYRIGSSDGHLSTR